MSTTTKAAQHTPTEREVWIDEEMANALDAGVFSDPKDPELRAYAERGWEREVKAEMLEALERAEKHVACVEGMGSVLTDIRAAMRKARGGQ